MAETEVVVSRELILVKLGELALKGLNRGTFEDALLKNLRRRLRELGEFRIRKAQSTVTLEPMQDGIDLDGACARVGCIFGIAAFSRALVTQKNMPDILSAAGVYLRETLERVSSFKVESKRADKSFPLQSPAISAEVGGYLQERYPHLRVDVRNPDVTVMVEIRDFGAYIHAGQLPGAGGMPVGTAGRAMLLLSGGIDSPVAAYMMAKRGLELDAVHFVSPPYTSDRAEQKVRDLLERLEPYTGRIHLHIIPFTAVQETIARRCPEDLSTLIMRRCMMRIATRYARRSGCAALVTGESLGQVASQTLPALACTEEAAGLPVLRPVIGMDKEEIISIARAIGTFDISVQPFEDCCTVFTPRHPRTRPKLDMLRAAERGLEAELGIVDERGLPDDGSTENGGISCAPPGQE